jgi:anaerobic magnesium-protoporphyrin IX monomethyl ester cyclase
MQVLLLEPPKVPWEMMGDVVAPPVGLAQLAGCLEQARIPVQILDANALGIGWKKLPAAIAEAAPDLIGMTVYTPYVPEVSRAVGVVREAAPQAVLALGGPHVTFTVEETLATMPRVDVVARGEGDQIIIDLARAVAGGGGLEGVPGISFRRDGQIVENPPAPPVDVKQLPMPAYHLLPTDRYHWRGLGGSFSTLVTSRGCPFKCTFCSEWPFWGGRWRPYDPRAVVEQLDLLVNRYGRRNIWFGDDCFNVDRDHVAAICEGILERGIQMSWFYQGRADMLVKHKDLLPLMRRAGNRMAQIGIEASNDEQRDELNKQLSTDTVKEAVRLLREHGMVCQGMMIVGLPDDSPQTFTEKVRLVKELDIDFPVFVFYTLFPGTPMYREAVERGLLEIPADYARHDMAHVLLPTKYMTRQQIYNYTGWALTRVYLHPVRLAKYLFSSNDLQRHLRGEMVSYVLKQAARSMMPGF